MRKNYRDSISLLSLNKLFLFIILLLINHSFGQGTTCITAQPIAINGCDPEGTAAINDGTQTAPNIATSPTSTACPLGTAFRREGWYTFTVTGGPLTINITATSTTTTSNLYLQLIASSDNTCTGTLSQIDCANNINSNGAQTENIYVSLPNGTYWVKVVNVGASGSGGMGLSSFCITNPPANDFCNNASSLTVNPTTTCTSSSNGTTVNATQSLAGCSGTADDDVWYKFVATSTNHTITVTPTTMTDAVFEVFSGICSGLTSLICTNSTSGSSAETSTISGLSIGTTYYVRVHSNASGSGQGTFNICVTTPSTPSNDNCAGSTSLTVNPSTTCTTSTTGTTFGATQSQSGCSGSADDDVWYTFVATNTLHTITVTPTTLNDAVFQVFSGSCAGLTSLGCVNSTSGTSAETTTISGLTIGNTYFVRIYSSSNYTGAGTFSVCVTTPPTPPSNNQCSGATALPCGTTSLAGTTVNTINYTHGSGCTMSDYGVWYTFTGDGQQTTISSTAGAGFDHEMAIASGSCGSLTNITCQDSALTGGTETYTFTTVSGTTYYVYIAYWGSGNTTGTFTISRTCSITATNDNCSGAVSLTVNSGTACTTSTNGTTVAASQSMAGCVGTADDDVWYSFVATSTMHTITVTPNTLSDVVFQVFSGNCAGLTGLGCIDSTSGTSSESTTLSTLTIGNTYYVRVYSYSNGASQGTFNICVTTPTSPCSSITNIATCNTTINATVPAIGGIMGTSSCGWTTPGYELIYSFTPTVTGSYYITQNSSYSYIDYQYKVASGGCGTTGWTCIDDMFGLTTSPNFTLTAGVQYYFMLDPESSTGGTVNFTLNCPLTPPTNDNCSGAIPLAVTNSCAYTIYSNAGATNSSGAPAPGCGGYSGGDVWFSITVPPSGILKIDSTSAVMTDGGMAAYTGTCGSLSLLQCNDDRGSDFMPYLNLYGLTPGSTIYIRYWENGNNNNGTFGLCVTTCSPGTSTGSSSAGCPVVIAGGLGLNGSDPNPVNGCSGTTCVDLEATYLTLGQTTNYNISSIPYSNVPYQFGCLSNAVSVNVDDVWSSIISLPFNFCFFGNTYSQCIMGSNGMLSFNTANAGGASGYSFSNNLPSTTGALFANTIYGVYHDIDPGKGGEVGWELITLKTGCRALVASWKDVPMFRTNTILYTGMMILYENTNIIEVYIQEKNIEFNGTNNWNDGNAIVGIQNAAGTTAVVAPGRNGLDTNWAVTNEAWRFTPSGPLATTVKWYQGSGTSGPVVGTSATLNVCPTVTTTYTAEITYSYCNGTTEKVTDETTVGVFGTKTWNGSIDTDWNKANNWTPSGIPTSSDCVIIPVTANNPIISGSGYNGLAGTLSVYNGASLTINSNNSLTVTSWVNIQPTGNFTINNNSSLVQISGSANTGNITYKRNASVRNQDFVYWASPVSSFSAGSISTPLNPAGIYTWNTTVANPNGGQGNWQTFSGAMIPGKGYIMRAPSSFSYSTPATWTATFTGVANNGSISVPIFRGSDTNVSPHYGVNGTQIDNYSDNWNLLGNPYPSAVRASQFLFDNRTKIMGNVRLWTHGTLPAAVSSPFYDTFVYNYSPGDYLTYNFTGASCCPAFGADLFIGSGQGFFVQMIDGPTGSSTISFNNNQRSYTYSNSSFYRFASPQNLSSDITNLERNRIWIDIVDSNNISNRALVGYIEEATMGEDNFFDCVMNNTNTLAIYSMIDQQKYNIQGRAIPFDDNDEVPVGVILPNGGSFNIALAGVDGLFNNQNIYLKDELTGAIHDIKSSPYQFTSESGEISNRFKIIYKDIALGNPSITHTNQVSVISNNNLTVLSTQVSIESVEVFNTLGQIIDSYKDVNSTTAVLSNIRKNNSALFLKIKLSNGQLLTKKTIY